MHFPALPPWIRHCQSGQFGAGLRGPLLSRTDGASFDVAAQVAIIQRHLGGFPRGCPAQDHRHQDERGRRPLRFSFWAGRTSNSWNGSLRFFALLIRSLFSMHPDTSTSLLRSHRLSFPALTEEKASSATPESIEPGAQGPS